MPTVILTTTTTVDHKAQTLEVIFDPAGAQPFTLAGGFRYDGRAAFPELPRCYRTARGARQAAARLTGEKLAWAPPEGESPPRDRSQHKNPHTNGQGTPTMPTQAPSMYIRTEPPALLTETLTLTLDQTAMQALNAYRQARHAYFATAYGDPDRERLEQALDDASAALALQVQLEVKQQLGEPDDWVAAES